MIVVTVNAPFYNHIWNLLLLFYCFQFGSFFFTLKAIKVRSQQVYFITSFSCRTSSKARWHNEIHRIRGAQFLYLYVCGLQKGKCKPIVRPQGTGTSCQCRGDQEQTAEPPTDTRPVKSCHGQFPKDLMRSLVIVLGMEVKFFSKEARVPCSSAHPIFSHVAPCSCPLLVHTIYILQLRPPWLRGVRRLATVRWWYNVDKSRSLNCCLHCVSRSLLCGGPYCTFLRQF